MRRQREDSQRMKEKERERITPRSLSPLLFLHPFPFLKMVVLKKKKVEISLSFYSSICWSNTSFYFLQDELTLKCKYFLKKNKSFRQEFSINLLQNIKIEQKQIKRNKSAQTDRQCRLMKELRFPYSIQIAVQHCRWIERPSDRLSSRCSNLQKKFI